MRGAAQILLIKQKSAAQGNIKDISGRLAAATNCVPRRHFLTLP
jgi:hypothetical protein